MLAVTMGKEKEWQPGLDEFRTAVLQLSDWEIAGIKAVLHLQENTSR
jgi:hypothetical protein